MAVAVDVTHITEIKDDVGAKVYRMTQFFQVVGRFGDKTAVANDAHSSLYDWNVGVRGRGATILKLVAERYGLGWGRGHFYGPFEIDAQSGYRRRRNF